VPRFREGIWNVKAEKTLEQMHFHPPALQMKKTGSTEFDYFSKSPRLAAEVRWNPGLILHFLALSMVTHCLWPPEVACFSSVHIWQII
jgi:hypothetical protein